MKLSYKIYLRKFNLYQVFLIAILAACESAPTYTSTPKLFTQPPTLLVTATETPLAQFRYTVFNGDTCAQIAFTFNVSEQSIIELNDLQPSCPIKPGQQLLVPYPTVSNIPTFTPPYPFEFITVANTLEFNRNEKIYTVTVATSTILLIRKGTTTPLQQTPELPSDAKQYRAKIKEVSDIDNDGEQEYIVLLNECHNFDCSDFVSHIKIYKYNPEIDNFYVFDEFKTDPEKIELEFGY